jgi:DNA-binding PadR family transcriptional regulator
MESEGLLTTEVEYIGKRVRKYYSVSKQGKAKAGEKIQPTPLRASRLSPRCKLRGPGADFGLRALRGDTSPPTTNAERGAAARSS